MGMCTYINNDQKIKKSYEAEAPIKQISSPTVTKIMSPTTVRRHLVEKQRPILVIDKNLLICNTIEKQIIQPANNWPEIQHRYFKDPNQLSIFDQLKNKCENLNLKPIDLSNDFFYLGAPKIFGNIIAQLLNQINYQEAQIALQYIKNCPNHSDWNPVENWKLFIDRYKLSMNSDSLKNILDKLKIKNIELTPYIITEFNYNDDGPIHRILEAGSLVDYIHIISALQNETDLNNFEEETGVTWSPGMLDKYLNATSYYEKPDHDREVKFIRIGSMNQRIAIMYAYLQYINK